MTSTRIWIKYDGRNTSIRIVNGQFEGAVIEFATDFKRAIKKELPNQLKDFDVNQLIIKKPDGEVMQDDLPIEEFPDTTLASPLLVSTSFPDTTDESPLLVSAPEPPTGKVNSIYES